VDDESYPWTGLLSGYMVISTWYWSCDQVLSQRALAAKDVSHGELGAMVAAMLKILPPFLLVLPGMAARVLMVQDGVLPWALEGSSIPPFVFDGSYPWLIGRVLPLHLRGLVVAAVLASLMSSLASVFNSAGTVVAVDLYERNECCRRGLAGPCRSCQAATARTSEYCC